MVKIAGPSPPLSACPLNDVCSTVRAAEEGHAMATIMLDARGLRCPQPVLRIAAAVPSLTSGDILEVAGDCPTFEEDVRKWCERMKKTLLAVTRDGNAKVIQIQF